MWSLETLGRQRLSRHFWMREFLHSEIASFHGLQNLPDDPERALAHGRALCETLLDPLEETFGRIFLRSGYRSAALNRFGNARKLNCARNDHPRECHVWDRTDIEIAGASVVIPWFAERYEAGRDWRDLAWWIFDHLPVSELQVFPKLCAFNIAWRPVPLRRIESFVAPRGCLIAAGAEPEEDLETRRKRYEDFPPFRGIRRP